MLLGGADGVLLGGALGVLLGGALGVLLGGALGVTLGGAPGVLLGGVAGVVLGGVVGVALGGVVGDTVDGVGAVGPIPDGELIPAIELPPPVTGLASRNSVLPVVPMATVGDCDGGALWMHPDTTTVFDEGDCGWADCAAASTLTTAPIARTAAMFRVMQDTPCLLCARD